MESIQKQIVIVGAGPAGVGAALRLKQAGFKDILLLDRFEQVGGIPGKYQHHGKPTFVRWSKGQIHHGLDYADLLAKKLVTAGIETRLETTVLHFSPEDKELQMVSVQNGSYKIKAEVILFACGARERTSVERGILTGHRPARVYHTLHLLELLKLSPNMPPANYIMLGSEVITYSLAEKLTHTGGIPLIIDHEKSAACSFAGRFYFFRKHRPRRIPSVRKIKIQGQQGLEKVHLEKKQSQSVPADYLVLAGNLIPNTELLATAGIPFRADSRQILPEALKAQQNRGIFIAGNMKGTAFGGERAYFNGYLTAGKIVNYLK
ncbi:MAG: FAD-dependent oxidoreductase [Deltaproteobacteria bacterium]|nr:FAD-dependent oxidoreductase [Deltaproteobacteria bacterium]MBT4644535.1 FAD-dependent oxidoreductase [Deltaproteobacteria bacterium]MBT6501454.1 FAD-dependent oxidoreductase [Deltaproteobacteria bacterium]MBT7713705.1 FAD-dependent oxidoreductase [Deltaproteobacteria bacterium]